MGLADRGIKTAGTAAGNGKPGADTSLMARALDYEDLVVHRGPRSGVTMAIAIHSTALGPALGGARMWHYRSPLDGVDDAMRLARAMTLKAAAAGLELGGGKAVICCESERPPRGEERRELLLDFGDAVESLGGRYVTAEDVGTAAPDMAVIAERTPHVVGLPADLGGSGDPSPLTARGVEAAIRACLERLNGSPSLRGVAVCVIGLGHVGSHLARRLAAAGAELTVSDIDPAKRPVAAALGARWIEAEGAELAPCDLLAPCALGSVVRAGNVAELRCRAICGSANNVLADETLAAELARRDVLYAPDFVANAGGLINVYAELRGYEHGRVFELVDGIGETMGVLLDAAAVQGITPLEAAKSLAEERLQRAAIAA